VEVLFTQNRLRILDQLECWEGEGPTGPLVVTELQRPLPVTVAVAVELVAQRPFVQVVQVAPVQF
jgi:hypothetical protein